MKNLPAEIIDRIYLHNTKCATTWAWHLDTNLVDFDKVRYLWKSGQDDRGCTYDIVRYSCSDGINRLCALYHEEDITAEDFTEWCASSCGMTYNAYIGKPWLD